MPFVQRVVQPTRLAQVSTTNLSADRFQCVPGKCKNKNCINKIEKREDFEEAESATKIGLIPSDIVSAFNFNDDDVVDGSGDKIQGKECNGGHLLEREYLGVAHVKDADTKIATKAIVHNNNSNGNQQIFVVQTQTPQRQKSADRFVNGVEIGNIEEIENISLNFNVNTNISTLTNGYSFTYGTDTEDSVTPRAMPQTLSPLKKLKQHVEFLPPTSPTLVKNISSTPTKITPLSTTATTSTSRQQQQQNYSTTTKTTTTTTTTRSGVKLVTGYEFESISNITLSNALRQLASLVLLASDIFDDLHHELQNIGERTQIVHRKIISVEQRVTAYDPKLVTVPESDLLTFAQRKIHYDSEKAVKSELFSAETRPCSVRVLYEDAGRVSPPATVASACSSGGVSPRSATSDGIIGNADFCDFGDTGVAMANANSDELVCTPVFGKANRKMRTRIDAEIEIRLPAAIEDLRKWTSTEALGDVTVTPDCMAHVDTSISTSVIIGDNGILTPALSPSVLSADAVDALYSINSSNLNNHSQFPSDVNTDVPLNHRLPSPEEQCKIIALRYPAEIISVDTSGKRFQRMCMARKSTTGCFNNNIGSNINSGNANGAGNSENATENNLNDDIQTVSRRSRSRKSRGKRRNTIAGIDQKEIQIAAAANGESTTNAENKNAQQTNNNEDQQASALRRNEEKTSSKKFGRSKSSDILKKESVALPYDKGKNTLTRLNSLKQWGRNRFKFMRNDYSATNTITLSPERGNGNGNYNDALNNNYDQKAKQSLEQHLEITNANTNVGGSEAQAGNPTAIISVEKTNLTDDLDVHELMGPKSEGRFSHERKPSYSSSEKSVSVSSSGHLKGKLHLATCGNVKLRDTSSLNRQRRNGISVNGLAGKDEQPHSSSGNWSASSESGRASIGSEITIQPKSSASNTSLNCSSFHPGSGPPSSMMSRRRFLNTSASSSVTSEGTATPDLQVVGDGGYPCHLDDETSSAYSCDTEGYYTSFHMDSGLRTLKEEEPTLLITQNTHANSYSFGSQHNQTVLSAENEYELFGKGSTSTTTSSAGTVCTTLMANVSGEQSSMNSINIGPDVPERISSLGKLNRSRESNSTSTSTLERSYSSSTMGSTLERTGTIKRNVNAGLSLVTCNVETTEQQLADQAADTPESQEEEFEFEHRIRRRSAQPLPKSTAEVEVSESSDLEGVERIERIKQKTALNARRIPSMCIITPTTSDDDQEQDADSKTDNAYDPDRTLTPENSPTPSQRSLKTDTEETLDNVESTPVKKGLDKSSVELSTAKDHNLNNLKRHSQYGLNNMLEKLKVVLPNIKRSPTKSSPAKTSRNEIVNDDELYDLAGEYVTIADVTNNNHARYKQLLPGSKSGGLGIYYSNDIVSRRKLLLNEGSEYAEATLPAAQNPTTNLSTEYVSLNELPTLRHNTKLQTTKDSNILNCAESLNTGEIAPVPMYAEISELTSSENSPLHTQKRVRLNAQGKVIYDSDSLKRRKGAHTTFAPGLCVKETESALPIPTTTNILISESATVKAIKNISTPAKLFLLNGGVAATRKIANVRPIISNTTLKQQPQQQQEKQQEQQTQQQEQEEIFNNKEMYSTTGKTMNNPFNIAYEDKKNVLANHTNPFYQQPLPAPPISSIATIMMPSPSTKSTSSTGSSHSTNTSGSADSSSNNINNNNHNNNNKNNEQQEQQKNAGSLHFYRAHEHLKREQPPTSEADNAVHDGMSFQRNSPVYWTLQNRRHNKAPAAQANCRDDLYATPIRRAERIARAANTAAATGSPAVSSIKSLEGSSGNTISPIIPRLRAGFHTSTPTRSNEPSPNRTSSGQFAEDSPERLNICADRIGQSKTSLLDFKKLLLAKSAKTSPVPRKVSAVELLKKNTLNQTALTPTAAATTTTTTINTENVTQNVEGTNSSLKLLDMSGSPKTFANRRMLRQGQFGSPSRSLAPKIKSNSPVIHNRQRTEIISTTIPEVNSEEDQSGQSSTSSSDSSKLNGSETHSVDSVEQDAADQTFDMKRNFFLQTEENNFMRGELKTAFGKSPVPTQKYVNDTQNANKNNNNDNNNNNNNNNSNSNKSLPALETAL